MLAQQQTEKIIQLLNNRVDPKFEKKPINENMKNFGFKPVKLIDFAKKDLEPFSQDVLQAEGQLQNQVELEASSSEENDERLNTEENQELVQDSEFSPSEISNIPNKTDINENSDTAQVLLEKERKQSYEEGYSAGFAAAESASEGDVISALNSLNKILEATESSDVFNKQYIKSFILKSIAQETSHSIGYCIDELPEKFHQIIQDKLDRFSYLNDKKLIKVNPEDYEAIRRYSEEYQGDKFEFVESADLERGSIVIEVGNISYKD